MLDLPWFLQKQPKEAKTRWLNYKQTQQRPSKQAVLPLIKCH